uniref:Carbohydrate ABC transporter permease n=1 Tax=Ignisphaera aggregans TaxID=334771 RepID=A0A7J3QEY5_9CREN
MVSELSKKIKTFLINVIADIGFIVGTIAYIIPFVILLAASLGAPVTAGRFIPSQPRFDGYIAIISHPAFRLWILNSIIFTVTVTTGSIIISTLAGYVLSRLDFPGKGIIFWFILGIMMIPGIVAYLPLYILLSKMMILGTYVALLIPPMSSPYNVFMLKQAFDAIPRDYEEAALIDGAGTFTIMFRIHLPIIRPVLTTLVLFNIVWNWNNFAWPLFISARTELWNLPLGIWNLAWSYTVNFWNLAAGAVILATPPLILYIIAIEYYLRGIAVTGLKK